MFSNNIKKNKKMKSKGLHGLMFLVAATGFSAVTMLLWNALLPQIFGVASINFWQALGLLVLSRILFCRFGGRHPFGAYGMGHKTRNALREKWMNMTPEERKEFVKKHHGYHGRCFGFNDNLFDEPFNGPSDKQDPEKTGEH
jgi:hypothetical protein